MKFEHSEAAEYILDHVSFTHQKQRYTGRGTLNWEPEKGLHIQAFLNQSGPDTRFKDFGIVRIEGRADQYPVRFRGYGFNGIAPRVFEHSLGEFLYERRLSIRPHNVILFRSYKGLLNHEPERKFWPGLAVFTHEKDFEFPDQLRTATTLNDEKIAATVAAGLSYAEDSGLSVWGRKTGENYYTVSWAFPRALATKPYSWDWAEAVRRALSILSGQTVWLAKREAMRGIVEITELRGKNSVKVLSDVHRPLNETGDPQRWQWNKSAFMQLSRFFAAGGTKPEVCWSLFRRLAEASRQDTWESRELLQATALEAALRTLDNRPFVPGHHNWNLRTSLEGFFRSNFDAKWAPHCGRVLDTTRRLRHRNAHPDWITHSDGSFTTPEWRESIEDLTYLSRFYGYMILALAGFKDIEPRFPQLRFTS